MKTASAILQSYLARGWQLVLVTGYHQHHNPHRDYSMAKAPIQTGWQHRRPTLQEAEAWVSHGGWIGLVVPAGCLALDIDTPSGITWLTKNRNPLWSVQKTRNGYHVLFEYSGAEDITGATHTCQAGFRITYRAALRNQIVVAPSPDREWLALHDTLVPLPAELYPERREWPPMTTLPPAQGLAQDLAGSVQTTVTTIRRMFTAPEGQKHFGRRNGGLLLGGLIGAGHLALGSAVVESLIRTGIENSNTPYKAEKTIRWGIEHGMCRPLDLGNGRGRNGGDGWTRNH